ncbi:general secretion pathway protein E [Formivibrio citricus]|uniref:General secretion pathway protein E n=1 Tax=Formivibrio citricus TaxID=83765 RepID=A0A1I4XBG1_9NEIS|nr:GspE/PulE family protein [Formivibrio citricus]SFN23258.1 general secretion pathway protein E [Formivibrio citricus]
MLATNRKLELSAVLQELVADKLLSAKDAEKAQPPSNRKGQEIHPLVVIGNARLVDQRNPQKFLSTEALTEWLAGKAGLPYFHIDPLKIDVASVCDAFSYAYATRFRILPVAVAANEITVATAEPFEREWQAELERALRLRIHAVVANPLDIVRYLAEFYNLARSVRHALDTHRSLPTGITNYEQLVKLGKTGSIDANDQAIVTIVDWLLQYAFEQRASDIHIEPRRDICLVRFRIDGIMHLVYQTPMPVMAAITNRIKLLARMDVTEKRRPQDGRIKTQSPAGEEIELRLSCMPTAFGEKLVLRIFNPDVLLRSFNELGFTDDELRQWQELSHRPHGIVLVTGPTGSGKTTTLYSTLRELATPEVNVCTVEDPIEMVYPHLNQMQVQHNIGLDFASGIRTLLRQDPDIVMVGEIRDLETAEMAIQAALTGHLVFSTLHTNDSASAITRMLDLGVPAYLIRATVLGVMAQRLARTVCPHCKKMEETVPQVWNDLIRPWKAPAPAKTATPVGCLECRMTGYLGRVGIYEMLVMTPALRELVVEGLDSAKLRDAAVKEGMRPLRIAGACKVAEGLTTPEEIARNTPPADGR